MGSTIEFADDENKGSSLENKKNKGSSLDIAFLIA